MLTPCQVIPTPICTRCQVYSPPVVVECYYPSVSSSWDATLKGNIANKRISWKLFYKIIRDCSKSAVYYLEVIHKSQHFGCTFVSLPCVIGNSSWHAINYASTFQLFKFDDFRLVHFIDKVHVIVILWK